MKKKRAEAPFEPPIAPEALDIRPTEEWAESEWSPIVAAVAPANARRVKLVMQCGACGFELIPDGTEGLATRVVCPCKVRLWNAGLKVGE